MTVAWWSNEPRRTGRGHLDNAPIAPTAWHVRDGSRRTFRPSIPPRAASRIDRCARRSRTAIWPQRSGPRPAAVSWLAVWNTGERNASWAPARAARRSSGTECPELVTKPCDRTTPGHRPPRKCTPAPRSRASRTSPATTSINLRARQIRARSRPSFARSGSASCRNTTPARPGGRRLAAPHGSGNRLSSVKSQSRGTKPRLPRNPQATSL
jgi:hypothetical protein